MSNAKLMTPLFYQGNFNADGKKMRAILVREVSNGTDTYRLWRQDGKPDRQYPQGEGDDYILYVELHGYRTGSTPKGRGTTISSMWSYMGILLRSVRLTSI